MFEVSRPLKVATRRALTPTHAGLKYVDVGIPLPATTEKAKGFEIGLAAVLEDPNDALVYAEHPAQEK